jgi:putative endonuclease
MRNDPRQERGRQGEELAAAYLRALGMTILHRNFRTRVGEIDIIARFSGILVFAEVRTRSQTDEIGPLASVGARKRRKLRKNVSAFLNTVGLDGDTDLRIDVIGVTFEPTGVRIEHVVDAV